MPRINVLDKQVSELIAAGEVIERPASIVKELLENAIDAGATAVTVEIKRGGIDFIRITDNGCGIEREDVPLAFLRHATSKVRSEQDLNDIATLGFRGEALASICAVAKVELLTKTAGEKLGTRMEIHGGETKCIEEAGCPQGSTILVRNLFYNVPARLKFLKKDTTEGSAVQGIVEKLALSHPEVSFRMIKDNKNVLHTAGDGKLLSAVYAVFGRDFAKSLLPVSYSYQGITVDGYITRPANARSNRSMQHFFVNHRYVKSRTCMAALEEAHKNMLMVSRFPACVLKLGIDFSKVDVNVHPAKIEIRFVQEKPVFEAVYFAVKTALQQEDILKTDAEPLKHKKPELLSSFRGQEEVQQTRLGQKVQDQEHKASLLNRNREDSFVRIDAGAFRQMMDTPDLEVRAPQTVLKQENLVPPPETADRHVPSAVPAVKSHPSTPPCAEPPVNQNQNVPEIEDSFSFLDRTSFRRPEPKQPETDTFKDPPAVPEQAENAPNPNTIQSAEYEEVAIRMVGELFRTYILFEAGETFVMMDKHAAHERILFEQLKQEVVLKESQMLLAPHKLQLTPEEQDVISRYAETFASYGFRFAVRDGQTSVTEAPLVLHKYPLASIVEELVKNIMMSKVDITPHVFEDLLHNMACRAAIKGNEEHTAEELEALAKRVYADPSIRHCPHGRPVGITMTKYEIEKRFGRIT